MFQIRARKATAAASPVSIRGVALTSVFHVARQLPKAPSQSAAPALPRSAPADFSRSALMMKEASRARRI
jgi:hypothetical protein